MLRSARPAGRLTKVLPVRVAAASFTSTAGNRGSYEDTIENLKIGSHTRVIFQGFTGKQATSNAKESIAWGTNIVGGVTPGKNGEHLGLPVLPTVREAMEKLKPDATGIYVAAHQAPKAIEEAIEAEVPLIVAVAEHIPIHDILRINSILKTQSKSRFVGANCPGIISSIGHCRIGFQPLPCFSPGRIGIVAKSGTLSYEAVASTTRSGLGQSLCVGMGGDVIAGTTFVDALKVFEHDPETEGIVIIGEIGGRSELDAVQWIREYKIRCPNPKPIAALIGGVHAAPGRVMGHAGAFTAPGEPDAMAKIKAFQDAGVTMVNHPAKFGEVMKTLLGQSGRASSGSALSGSAGQKRGMHTMARRLRPSTTQSKFSRAAQVWPPVPASPATQQKRTLYVSQEHAFDLLRQHGISTSNSLGHAKQHMLAVAIDRTNKCPAIIVTPNPGSPDDIIQTESRSYPFDYHKGFDTALIPQIALHLGIHPSAQASLQTVLTRLVGIFMQKEAFLLETSVVEHLGGLEVVDAHFGFDDAAFRSTKRQQDIHGLRQIDSEDPAEIEAEKEGIVYIKYEGEGNIGTLVNGAGLAMNTVDALADAGGVAANFLDTGGKATAETVKKSFEVILRDQRVKAIFVNIFGGLTLGDMIANGVLLAFKELDMKVPVVVRIRGTNEEEGQRIIAESGLKLFAYDDFEEAARKVIELANAAA